jgi:hypothetical protein
MTDGKLTLGQAIDQVEKALSSFEGADQQTILAAVCSHLKIAPLAQLSGVPVATAQNLASMPATATPDEVKRLETGSDIKSLKNEKQPNSARQMACVVAYYLSEYAPEKERKATVTVADLAKYFKQAGYPLPQNMDQLLVDCKRSGYMEAEARGEYGLTPVGHNLVVHNMPAGKRAS